MKMDEETAKMENITLFHFLTKTKNNATNLVICAF